MGELRNFLQARHGSVTRVPLARMNDDKVHCMAIAKEYAIDYWDGDRRYGYGGYKWIDGYWTEFAKHLINTYGLCETSSVLDLGCGKGYLLTELRSLIPGIQVQGVDSSIYALENCHPLVSDDLVLADIRDPLDWLGDNQFDLVVSLGTFHNLRLPELMVALSEMNRVGTSQYLMVESYENHEELFNLQCWALTAESFLDEAEWVWLFDMASYAGDYEFIKF